MCLSHLSWVVVNFSNLIESTASKLANSAPAGAQPGQGPGRVCAPEWPSVQSARGSGGQLDVDWVGLKAKFQKICANQMSQRCISSNLSLKN